MRASEEVAQPAATAHKKIAFLEAVRGVAAVIVVVQHILAAQVPMFDAWSREYLDLGRVGVVAFFVVSGYVIPLSLERQSARVFVIRRVFRLFPLYWISLAAFLLLAALAPQTGSVDATPLMLIANVLMIQGLTPLLTIVPTAWTLGIELLFYVQELAAAVAKRLAAAVYLGYVWLGVFVVAEIVCRIQQIDLPATLPLLLYTAAIGQALYLRDRHASRAWQPLVAAGLVLVPVFTFVGGDHDPQWPPLNYAVSFLVGLLLFAVFYVFTKGQLHPILVWLGAVSYALYLIHPLAYRVVALTGVNPVVCIVGSVALSLVAAWVLHRTIELPFIAIGRRVSGRHMTTSSA